MTLSTLIAGLPPELDLDGGYTIRVDAIDATTGATVSGITVSDVTITARNLSGAPVDLTFGPFLFLPVESGPPVGPPVFLSVSEYPGPLGGTIYYWGYVDIAQGNNLGPRAGELPGYGGTVASAQPEQSTYLVNFPDGSSNYYPLPTS